jgi:hypothetical protein
MKDPGETLNIKVIEESIALLERGETQSFDIRRIMRGGFLSYDFELE